MVLNRISSVYADAAEAASGTGILPSSMLTTSDIVGLNEGDVLVHWIATLVTVSTSCWFTSGFNFSSTSSINLEDCCK